MSSVQWLNLNRVKLHEIPEEIGKLGKLVCIIFKFFHILFIYILLVDLPQKYLLVYDYLYN